jgi:N-acetyl-beta-hexosaminidase
MASWRGSGVLANCYNGQGKLVPSSMLDPSKESTFSFIKEFLKGSFILHTQLTYNIWLNLFPEVLEIFPDPMIHLGGDEVAFWTNNCWLD